MKTNLIKKALREFMGNNLVEAEHFFKKALYTTVHEKISELEKNIIMEINYDTYGFRPLSKIAEEIEKVWGSSKVKSNKSAFKYLKAMQSLEKITDSYYEESGKSIVEGFLASTTSWVGSEASKIKKELKAMLAGIPLSESGPGTCSVTKKKEMGDEDDVMEGDESDESSNEKPKKIGKKYLLQDGEEEENDIFEEEVIADTDMEKGVLDALNNWGRKIESSGGEVSFDSTIVYRGNPFYINYVGKIGEKFKVKVGVGSGRMLKMVDGRTVKELVDNVYKMILGNVKVKSVDESAGVSFLSDKTDVEPAKRIVRAIHNVGKNRSKERKES